MDHHRPHILSRFDISLDSLRADLSMMADLAKRVLHNSTAWLLTGEFDRCQVAINDDAQIDAIEKTIARDGIELLTRFQPVASDLRQVVTSIRCSEIIERVGHEAAQIARRAPRLTTNPSLKEMPLLQGSWSEPTKLFIDSVSAYFCSNVRIALAIQDRNRKFDVQALEGELTVAMKKRPQQPGDYIHLLSIIHCLKRVGDYAANIAEEAIYLHEAKDIRHANNRFTSPELD